MMPRRDAEAGRSLHGTAAAPGTVSRAALVAAVILIYWAYAGLGRDIVHNKLNDPAAYDPIGAVLNYARIAACVFGIAAVAAGTTLDRALRSVPVQFAPFVAIAFASVVWADHPKQSFQHATLLGALWLALPMTMHRLGAASAARAVLHLIAVVCVSSFLLAVFVPEIGRHTGLEAVQYSHAGRWRGIFGHKNALGPWAAYGAVIPFTHPRLLGGSRRCLWFAGTCAVACLVFSGSSTAFVMAAALLVVRGILLLLRRGSPGLVAGATLGAGLAAAALLPIAADGILDLVGRDTTLSGRTVVWDLALRCFRDSPFVGHGFGSLGGADFLAQLRQTVGQAIPGPESGYMTLLLDLGLVGCVLFLAPFLAALRNGLEWLPHADRADRDAIEVMLMTLGAVLVHAVTESGALVAVSFDGILGFGALFFLMTLPRSPPSILRRDFRKARYWTMVPARTRIDR